MLKREAKQIVGGLSKPSKMPGMAYGLPAKECKVGSKLAKVAGSVCANCYALKGSYRMYPAVEKAQYRRLESLQHPLWVEAMTTLIKGQEVFRWHDSGDLQDAQHLDRIVQVCYATPETLHWLPTRERGIISRYKNELPDNLIIRESAAMVGGRPPSTRVNTSTVHRASATSDHELPVATSYYGHECPAYKQGGECGSCRACWDKTIDNVSYKEH